MGCSRLNKPSLPASLFWLARSVPSPTRSLPALTIHPLGKVWPSNSSSSSNRPFLPRVGSNSAAVRGAAPANEEAMKAAKMRTRLIYDSPMESRNMDQARSVPALMILNPAASYSELIPPGIRTHYSSHVPIGVAAARLSGVFLCQRIHLLPTPSRRDRIHLPPKPMDAPEWSMVRNGVPNIKGKLPADCFLLRRIDLLKRN